MTIEEEKELIFKRRQIMTIYFILERLEKEDFEELYKRYMNLVRSGAVSLYELDHIFMYINCDYDKFLSLLSEFIFNECIALFILNFIAGGN